MRAAAPKYPKGIRSISLRLFIVLTLAALVIGFFAGLALATRESFPFAQFRHVSKVVRGELADVTTEIEIPVLADTDEISSLISMSSIQAIVDRRALIVEELGSGTCLSDSSVSNIEQLIPIQRDNHPFSIESVLLSRLPLGFESRAKYFRSTTAPEVLVIYHTGHSGQTKSDTRNIQLLLKSGVDVVAVDLPLLGDNNQPVLYVQNIGKVQISRHDQLRLLESDEFNSLVLFVEPTACLLNFFSRMGRYEVISQIGISGGGHVATLSAALDKRISITYAIAGTAPAFLRFANPTKYWGDYEQVNRWLLQYVSDLDIYLMAAEGDNRRYIQVFNTHDPCCFSGRAPAIYRDIVIEKMRSINGGHYDMWFDDDTTTHEISSSILSRIMKDLKSAAVKSNDPG